MKTATTRTTMSVRIVVVMVLAMAGIGFSAVTKAITLVPPSIEYSVKPGDVVETKLKLYNESTTALTVYAQTSNFTAADEEGSPLFDFSKKPSDIASWVQITEKAITLAPNGRADIPVTIRVPAGADPGGHYASIFFGNNPPQPSQSGQVAVQSLIGTLVIMRVDGQINESAKVTSMTILGGKGTLTRPPLTIKTLIANQGNVHVRPEGTVIIRNMFGGQTASLVFNSVRGAILPSSSRHFDVTWQKGTAEQKGSGFFHEVSAQWHNFALGTYTASLSAAYGTNQQALASEVRFTIFPWQLLLVLLIVIVAIIIGVTLGIRRYNMMIIRRAERGPGQS